MLRKPKGLMRLHITGVPEGKEKGSERLFKEIIAKKFPNLGKEIGIQIQEYHLTLKKKRPHWDIL